MHDLAARCEPRPASVRGTGCQCSTRSAGADDQDEAESWEPSPLEGWGLPAAGCVGNWTDFFVNEYPALHRMWRAQNRTVVHCSGHAGLGNWLRGLGAALMYSVFTKQALTLRCDDEVLMRLEGGRDHYAIKIHEPLAHFFASPHIDWNFDLPSNPHRKTVHLAMDQMKPHKWAWNYVGGSRVVTTLATYGRRVLLFGQGHAKLFPSYAMSQMGRLGIQHLDGCLLRYLLAPRPAMRRAVREATNASLRATSLLPIAALHVRHGDSHMMNDDTATGVLHRTHVGLRTHNKSIENNLDGRQLAGLWDTARSAKNINPSFLEWNPVAALECLLRLSDRNQGCMGCMVIGDTPWVQRCGQRLFKAPAKFPGRAVHLSASSQAALEDTQNVHRVYLDWFVLAQSEASILLSPGSTFSSTASSYKKASLAPGKQAGLSFLPFPHIAVDSRFTPPQDGALSSDDDRAARWWETHCPGRMDKSLHHGLVQRNQTLQSDRALQILRSMKATPVDSREFGSLLTEAIAVLESARKQGI